MAENVYNGKMFVIIKMTQSQEKSDSYHDIELLGVYNSLNVALNELQCKFYGTVDTLMFDGHRFDTDMRDSMGYTDDMGYDVWACDHTLPRGMVVYTKDLDDQLVRTILMVRAVDSIK